MLTKKEQDAVYKKLGEIIKAERIKAGIKQEELSTYLGFVSRISIANIESGKQKIQLHTLIEIADFLKLSITDLIPPLETIRKEVNPKLVKKIGKEGIDDPGTVEKIKDFIRFSTSKK